MNKDLAQFSFANDKEKYIKNSEARNINIKE